MVMFDLLVEGMKDSYFLLVFTAISFLLVYLTAQKAKVNSSHNPKNLPLPPGPKGWPLIGILFNMPSHKPWVTYNEWAKIYGIVMSSIEYHLFSCSDMGWKHRGYVLFRGYGAKVPRSKLCEKGE